MMKKTKRSRIKFNATLAALVSLVVIAGAVAVASLVSQAVRVNLALTDDLVATIYVLCLVTLYQFIAWVTPRRR